MRLRMHGAIPPPYTSSCRSVSLSTMTILLFCPSIFINFSYEYKWSSMYPSACFISDKIVMIVISIKFIIGARHHSCTLNIKAEFSFETSVRTERVHRFTWHKTTSLTLTTSLPSTAQVTVSSDQQVGCLGQPGGWGGGSDFRKRFITHINPLNPSNYCMYHLLQHTKLCILPTQCICVFRMVLTINSDCFPKQH
jgi:hypothetical protein